MQTPTTPLKNTCLHLAYLLVVVSLFPIHVASAQDETRSPQQLAQALSHVDEHVRANAEQALLKLGDDAIEVLEAGCKSVDIDFSSRCSSVLEKLLKQLDEEKAKAFLEVTGEEEERFVAWLKFKSIVGEDSKESREFFQRFVCDSSEHFKNCRLRGAENDDPASAVAFAKKIGELSTYRASNAGRFLVDLMARERLEKHRDSPEVKSFREQLELNTIGTLRWLHSSPPGNYYKTDKRQEFFSKLLVEWYDALPDTPEIIRAGKQRLILASQSKALIGKWLAQYAGLDRDKKVELLDILDSSTRSKKDIDAMTIASWLAPTLKDEQVLMTTRFLNRPGKKQEVTARRFALAVAYRNLFARGEIKEFPQATVFGKFPLTSTPIKLLVDREAEEAVQAKILELVDSEKNTTPKE